MKIKNLLSVILALALISVAFVGCGSEETKPENKTAITTSTQEVESEEVSTPTVEETEDEVSEEETEEVSTGLSSDFKEAMDSYEEFMSDYVDFMKKYQDNPTDMSLLSDYSDFISEYAEITEEFSDWEDEDLNTEELAYYLDVQTRVNKKLLEVAE